MIHAAPEAREQITRTLTGDLDTWIDMWAGSKQTAQQPAPSLTLPRPPSWSRIRPADIARMAEARGGGQPTAVTTGVA